MKYHGKEYLNSTNNWSFVNQIEQIIQPLYEYD